MRNKIDALWGLLDLEESADIVSSRVGWERAGEGRGGGGGVYIRDDISLSRA